MEQKVRWMENGFIIPTVYLNIIQTDIDAFQFDTYR